MMPRLCLSPLWSDDELTRHTTPAERAEAACFNPRRCREWLTWRALVRQKTGAETAFSYDAAGGPLLVGRPERIAVSHAADRVAVLLAETPCGLDLERIDRPFRRVVPRCLTEAEQALSDDPLFLAAAWCAKEALFKFGRDRSLSLLHDLQLERFGRLPATAPLGVTVEGAELLPCAELTARIRGGALLRLTAARTDEHLLVWIL